MGEIKTALVRSFGCRASQADGAALESALRAQGVETVREGSQASLIVLNTCTVTHSADVDARRLVRNMRRDHPQARILVTGCYAQRAPEELLAIEGVTWVVGNSHKVRIPELVTQSRAEDYHGEILHEPFGRGSAFAASVLSEIGADRTRPNLKVQDGCSNRCSFCIIPSVRGPSRSADLDSVLAQMRRLGERYCEVVLTGINLGRWGRDLPDRPRFHQLVRRILDETPVRRLRISSVEPMDWSDELISLMAGSERVAQHVHMPLQSGSDAVLKRMNRRYRRRHYAGRLEVISRMLPEAAIGADVMTGFPGETDADFAETIRFIEEQPFTYLHVFTYSERPGTTATTLPQSVPVRVRRERTEALRALSQRKWRQFAERFLNRAVSAVTLEEPGVALTSNYLRVRMSQQRGPNHLVDLVPNRVEGEVLHERDLFPILS